MVQLILENIWAPNLGVLGGQQALLATEPSLQPHIV